MRFMIDYERRLCAGVYCIVCYPTGDMYIGGTGNFLARYKQHLNNASCKYDAMYRIIRAIGPENFGFELMCELANTKERNEAERALILELNPTLNANKGYKHHVNPVPYELLNPFAVIQYTESIMSAKTPQKPRPEYKFSHLSRL